jgi:restriction system protein
MRELLNSNLSDILIAVFVIGVVAYVSTALITIVLPKHHRQIKRSYVIIAKLKGFTNEGSVIAFLKKIDPYIFEEVILSALKQKGCKIRRSPSYSGDGGVDGEFVLNGERYLVQSKRYQDHIKLQHIKEFISVCDKKKTKGIFCHTGRTGKQSWKGLANTNVSIISGHRLVALIKGGVLDIR